MRRANITRRCVSGVETPTLYDIHAMVTSGAHSSRASFGWGKALEALRWTASPGIVSSILRVRFRYERVIIRHGRAKRTLVATNTSSHRSSSVPLTMKNPIRRATNTSSPQLESMLPMTSSRCADLQNMLLAYLCSVSCANCLFLSPMLIRNRPCPTNKPMKPNENPITGENRANKRPPAVIPAMPSTDLLLWLACLAQRTVTKTMDRE